MRSTLADARCSLKPVPSPNIKCPRRIQNCPAGMRLRRPLRIDINSLYRRCAAPRRKDFNINYQIRSLDYAKAEHERDIISIGWPFWSIAFRNGMPFPTIIETCGRKMNAWPPGGLEQTRSTHGQAVRFNLLSCRHFHEVARLRRLDNTGLSGDGLTSATVRTVTDQQLGEVEQVLRMSGSKLKPPAPMRHSQMQRRAEYADCFRSCGADPYGHG